MAKPVAALTPIDLGSYPVWQLLPESDDHDETWACPAGDLPVDDLTGCLVGTTLHLSCGATVPAILGNVSLHNKRKTEQFLCVRVFRADGDSFDLARYHDIDADRRGPTALAEFLGLSVTDVFPMTYDISSSANGLREVVLGTVPCEPDERLPRDELIDLALE